MSPLLPRAPMPDRPSTRRIQEFYDTASPLYQKLWGGHIHHGYFRTGRESKEQATEALIEFLAEKSSLKSGAKVLDVGCGIGGTSIWLAENLNCDVTGLTISPGQVELAEGASAGLKKKPRFVRMDANDMPLHETFDAIWAVEVLSHLRDHANFFRKCHSLLTEGGRLCIAAWLKAERLPENEERKYIQPIEEGMFCALRTAEEYLGLLEKNRFRVAHFEDISPRVEKTWDIGLDIIRDKAVWSFAARNGRQLLNHLKSFRSMKRGFGKKKFRYGVIIAEK